MAADSSAEAMTSTAQHDYLVAATACVWQSNGHRTECVDTLNELVAEFGDLCVVDAIFESSLSERLKTVGGDQMRVGRMVVAEICQARNMGMTADLIALALGLGQRAGQSLTDVARRHGVTKQAASHALGVIVKRLDLPRVYCQLSDQARESYRAQNRRST
jgi:hypothetical protein